MKPGRLSPVAIVQYTDRYTNMMKRSIADMDRKTATWLRFLRIFSVLQNVSVLFILLVPLGYKCLFNFMQQYMDLEISFELLKNESPEARVLSFWKPATVQSYLTAGVKQGLNSLREVSVYYHRMAAANNKFGSLISKTNNHNLKSRISPDESISSKFINI